jgi:beta-galactosidase
MIKTTTSEALFSYTDKFYSQMAAITCNKYGSGKVYYVGSGVDEDILNIIAEMITKETVIQFEKTPKAVEVVYRRAGDDQYKFVINHNEYDVIYEDITLEAYQAIIKKIV